MLFIVVNGFVHASVPISYCLFSALREMYLYLNEHSDTLPDRGTCLQSQWYGMEITINDIHLPSISLLPSVPVASTAFTE